MLLIGFRSLKKAIKTFVKESIHTPWSMSAAVGMRLQGAEEEVFQHYETCERIWPDRTQQDRRRSWANPVFLCERIFSAWPFGNIPVYILS